MIKILIFADSYKFYKEAIDEFEKRLGKNIQIIKLKPSKKDTTEEVIKIETEFVINELSKNKGYKILLDINGKIINTEELKSLIDEKVMIFSDVIFIIGGAYGFEYPKIYDFVDYKLSFSKMTFTHIESLLILLEQIYRIKTIEKGTGYHH